MVAEGALQQQTSNKVKRQHRSVTVCFLPTRLSSGQLTGCPDWIGVVGLCLTVSLTAGDCGPQEPAAPLMAITLVPNTRYNSWCLVAPPKASFDGSSGAILQWSSASLLVPLL